MSEVNLIDYDAIDQVYNNLVACQTFTPIYDHTLHWVDLDLQVGTHLWLPQVFIYHATEHHHPEGGPISYSEYIVPPLPQALQMRRVRFKMTPYDLKAFSYYCIIVKLIIPFWYFAMFMAIKRFTNPYERGIRAYSNDSGETWTNYPDDDYIFGEFGSPPSPPPPPEPPIKFWMPTDIEQIPITDGFRIVYHTNVPVHLFMRWTTIPPVKHIVPVPPDTAFIKKDIRQCFVAYHENEQLEEGDTLKHTFIKIGWAICETRYFYFWGTNFNETVKSTSPIFTKHRKAALIMALVYLEPWSEEGAGPPVMVLKFFEPWTYLTPPPPAMTQKFNEPWTS